MRFKNLQDWLGWQESLNPKEIDLGLDRVSEVLETLNIPVDFFCPVITVAGTNGKGSTVAFIESILQQSDISVGCYTSPHLFAYNERIRINQQPVSDEVLCEVFEQIDQARAEIPLTYFEFGTLAALLVFKRFNVDVAVLEVGLGGRLDAVNVINAEVSVITSIDIDHVDWLGNDKETIGREKAGIMRAGKTTVLAFINPPQSVLAHAQQIGAKLLALGQDYLYQGLANGHWRLHSSHLQLDGLMLPGLRGSFQLQNAAAAIMAITSLNLPKPVNRQQINSGLQRVKLEGRFQQIQPNVYVDVAHNEQSARMLRDLLEETAVSGQTIAVVAMLSDKAVNEVLKIVDPQIDQWISAGLNVGRGLSAKNIAEAVRELQADVKLVACETVAEALAQANALATGNDRVIVFGSFYTVAEATKSLHLKS